MSLSSRRPGFTLVELLVVVSIIGFLATLAMVSVSVSAKKARDARRRTDLRQIQKAVELYNDENQSYPNTSGNWYGTCSSYGSKGVTGSGGYVPDLAPTYIPILPVDPRPYAKPGGPPCSSLSQGCYIYRSDGASYKVAASCGVEAGYPNSNDPFYDTAGHQTDRIMVCGGADANTACNAW
jgi:prepilin-type N-terminal cleavage/methylation domain-containing protein